MAKISGKGDILAVCQLPAWAQGDGPTADVAISTRASVSRNLAGMQFPNRADPEARLRVLELVAATTEQAGRRLGMALRPYVAESISEPERLALWEAFQMHFDKLPCHDQSAAIVSENRRVCVVVNGDDHVRFSCVLSGLAATEACDTALAVAETFGGFLRYAHDQHFGYLTARPALAGTGMRVSALLHLAALHRTERLTRALRSASEMETATGSLLPPAGRSQEGLVELSNRRTAEVNVREVAANVDEAARHLVTFEQEARDALLRDRRQEMIDETSRALGTLRAARLLSSAEALSHVGTLRLGVGLGLVRGLDARALNRLALLVAPGLLQVRVGRAMAQAERRTVRARLVRTYLRAKDA